MLISNQHLRTPGRQNHQAEGHIHPHQCDADDDVVILGANLAASDVHAAAVWEMEQNDKSKLPPHRDCSSMHACMSYAASAAPWWIGGFGSSGRVA